MVLHQLFELSAFGRSGELSRHPRVDRWAADLPAAVGRGFLDLIVSLASRSAHAGAWLLELSAMRASRMVVFGLQDGAALLS